jgi:hypothetical protein
LSVLHPSLAIVVIPTRVTILVPPAMSREITYDMVHK